MASVNITEAMDVPEDEGAWTDTLFNVLSSAARQKHGPERPA